MLLIESTIPQSHREKTSKTYMLRIASVVLNILEPWYRKYSVLTRDDSAEHLAKHELLVPQ